MFSPLSEQVEIVVLVQDLLELVLQHRYGAMNTSIQINLIIELSIQL